MKKYLNIDLNGTILTISCQYDAEAQTYILDEEIVVKQWTIKKVIKHCDSHDYNANYEYIIKDKYGLEKIKKYYYTGRSIYHPNECGLKGADDYSVEGVLSFFIHNSPIFNSKDWGEYDLCRTIYEIKKIIDSGTTKQHQLQSIKKIIDSVK